MSSNDEKVEFKLNPVKAKPSREYKKGSKYDAILQQFQKSDFELVEVQVAGKTGNYMRTQLNNRIEALGIKGVKVSVINDTAYLEKEKPKAEPKKKEE